MKNQSKTKATIITVVAFFLFIVAFLWRKVFPKRENGDQTSMVDDLTNSLTISNPFMSAKKTSEAIIKKWEGFFPNAYRDSGGIWTIGWGTIMYTDGRRVQEGDVITKDQAQVEFDYEFNDKWNQVVNRSNVELSDGMLAACVSFAYNVGLGALFTSTLWQRLQNGESANDVKGEWLKWVYVNKKEIAGLKNRRLDEQNLSLT